MRRARILCTGLAVAAAMIPALQAKAALPPEAYEGSLGDRLTGGFSCVGQTFQNPSQIVLPQSLGKFAAPGTYVWWNGKTRQCEQGGRPYGPQF